MTISIERKTAAGFSVAVLLLVSVSIITYRNAQQSLADTRWIGHTHEVIAELNTTQGSLDDWNTAANGYLLTGENSYLKPYRDAFTEVLNHVNVLSRLTSDNPVQQARVSVLHSQVMVLFGTLDRTVNSRHEGGFEAARGKVVIGNGRPEMTAVRATIAAAKSEEERLLSIRERQSQKTSRVAGIAFSAIVFLQLAIIGMIYSTVRKDIRERRRAAELLQESDDRHRKLFDNNPHPTWVYDRKTLRFLAVNAAAIRKYGYSSDEFLAMTVKDIRPSEDVPALLESVAQIKEETEHVSDWRHRRKNGSLLDVEITSYPLNFNGRPSEVVVAVDITQKKRADEERSKLIDSLGLANQQLEIRNREVEHATKLKSKFLASMSHELRTPLNAIVGFSGLLADGTAGQLSEKQDRFVGHIKNGAHHLLQLINDILDLSKIEAGQLEIHCEDFHIEDAIPEVLSTIRPLAMAKGIHLQSMPETERAVYADRIRFKQILYNLLSNAIKFTPEGGHVAVHWSEKDSYIWISVTDTGIGIREEDQQVIFEEFRQIEGNELQEGTGLGLAITKRLVEQQGGRVWLESRVGRGSRFSFILPAGGQDAGQASQTPINVAIGTNGHAQVPRHRQPLILIVDDEVPARELLTSYLEPEGYRTEVASTAAEAVEKAKQLQPDAITLDVLMPNSNGFETLLSLKGTSATAHIPIIVVSIVDQQKVGFALGAADYLVKPVEKGLLLNTIRKYTQARQNQDTMILIADDDSATVELLEAMLRSAGYQTLTAADGKAALALLSRNPVDGILLDLVMPEMDGFAVLRHIKAEPQLRDIPVFILTAKTLTEADASFLKHETHALFCKDGPWREELIETLGKTIQQRNPESLARIS